MKKRLTPYQIDLLARSIEQKRRRQIWRDSLITILIFSLLVTGTFLAFFRLWQVEDFSMLPNLQAGDHLLLPKHKDITRFDLIAFDIPGQNKQAIRRVVGLPGEDIRYYDDILYVGSREIPERFLSEELLAAKEQDYQLTQNFTLQDIPGTKKQRIPENHYLVLADNRSFGVDSRDYGLIAKDNILGVASGITFPISTYSMLQFRS